VKRALENKIAVVTGGSGAIGSAIIACLERQGACAVSLDVARPAAETDVINMVSRGISRSDILKGIHLSMAGRYTKLLRSIGACGDVAITGGLATDIGLCRALEEKIAEEKLAMSVRIHPDSVYAGAIGAALWGAYRHRVLARRTEVMA